MKRILRIAMAVVMLAMPAVMTGCYGSFPLTRAVYNFNGTVTQNGVGQSLIMWILCIFPVYQFAMVGDAIILNLVEFWKGEKVTIQSGSASAANDITLMQTADPAVAILTYPGPDGKPQQATVRRISASRCDIIDQNGKRVGMMTESGTGNLDLTTGDGTVVATVTAEQIKAMTATR